MVALVDLVVRLRGPDGCPWDAKQTDASIKVYLLEEAYEVMEALERTDPKDVCQELGDLLFQIVFLAHLAGERGDFDFIDVIEKITEKMIRRHPHVFAEAKVDSAEDVAFNWAKIKRAEKEAAKEIISDLRSVPKDLPALMRAHRLGERVSKTGLDWLNSEEMWEKVVGEFENLRTAVTERQGAGVREGLGKLLLGLANVSRLWGYNAENLLRLAIQEYLERLEKMESVLKSSGVTPEAATSNQLKEAWAKTKESVG